MPNWWEQTEGCQLVGRTGWWKLLKFSKTICKVLHQEPKRHQQRALAAMTGCISTSAAKDKEGDCWLWVSVCETTSKELHSVLYSLAKKDTAIQMWVRGWNTWHTQEGVCLLLLKRRRLQCNSAAIFEYLKGCYREDGTRLFSKVKKAEGSQPQTKPLKN